MHTAVLMCHPWMSFVLFDRNIGFHLSINKSVDACIGTNSHVTSLEHVQARLTLSYNRRGNLAIHLISPAGTRSTLLHPRYKHTQHTYTCAHTHAHVDMAVHRSPAGLMTTRQRVLMTGLSWPPTPGMRTPPGHGHWRSRTWPVPVTMVRHFLWEISIWWILSHICVFISRILQSTFYLPFGHIWGRAAN